MASLYIDRAGAGTRFLGAAPGVAGWRAFGTSGRAFKGAGETSTTGGGAWDLGIATGVRHTQNFMCGTSSTARPPAP